MSFILRWCDKLAEIEDEEVVGTFNGLYGPLLQITFLFPSWKRTNILLNLAILLFYTFSLLLHFAILSVSVVKLRDDFESACLAFHFWLIFVLVFALLILLNVDRNIFAETHRYLGRDVGVYKAGRIYSEKKIVMYEKNKRKELIQFLFLPGMVVLLAALVLGVPYLQKINNPPHYNRYGVNMNLPLATYYPFPTNDGLLHGLVVFGQLTAALSLALVVTTCELLLFRVSQSIIFEYKVLQYALESLFKRAKRLFLELHPDHQGRNVSYIDPRYQYCIGVCIKDVVKHHYKILEFLSGYETVLKWPAALGYGIGTGVIGLCLVNLLMAKERGDLESIVIFTMLGVLETLNMYILSAFGEDITTESAAVRQELYFIEWQKLDIRNRRLMLNFQVGVTNPVIVKAGGVVALCMDTFSSIMNTSYSFFNLMNVNPLEGR